MRNTISGWFVVLVLLATCGTTQAQHYTDWTEFEFMVGAFNGEDVLFYELTRDYTISLPEYFLVEENMPGGPEYRENATYYHNWAASLPQINWDFIQVHQGGVLTIREGYRWDGASNPIEEMQHHNFRSSLIHDALYDLMRMGYLQADHHHQLEIPGCNCLDTHILWNAGDTNRAMADLIHFLIEVEDGDGFDEARFDFVVLRNHGACRSHCDDMLASWKYRVHDLAAYNTDEGVDLVWKPADEALGDPSHNDHFPPYVTYYIYRDGTAITQVPLSVTSYTDSPLTGGTAHGYQILPMPHNPVQYDWSNEEIVIPMTGPGNALRLDGVDDYVEANTIASDFDRDQFPHLPSPVTMEAWVYPEDVTGVSAILSFNTISNGNNIMLMYHAGYQRFCYFDDENQYIYSDDQFAPGHWYHLAVAMDVIIPSLDIMYVDGVEQAVFNVDTPEMPYFGSQFSIGQEWDASGETNHFEGMIDEARIWKVKRTQEEIQDAMLQPLRGDEEGLVGLWHFDEPHDSNLFQETQDATAYANDAALMGYSVSDLPFVPSGAMVDPTGVDDIPPVDGSFVLQQNYPNPFNPGTTIEFNLPRTTFVKLEVFDLLGLRIRTLIDESLPAGNRVVVWDGRDNRGDGVASGMYIYRLKTDLTIESRRMLLLK